MMGEHLNEYRRNDRPVPRDVLEEFARNNSDNPNIDVARRELMIAQGSDWFWWYGEPNNSEQDYIFDYLFREHLKNAYNLLNLNYPDFLDKPLINTYGSSTRHPHGIINPSISPIIIFTKKNVKHKAINIIIKYLV